MDKFLVCVRTHYMFMIMNCTNDRHLFICGCLKMNVLKVLFLFSVVHPWTDLLIYCLVIIYELLFICVRKRGGHILV